MSEEYYIYTTLNYIQKSQNNRKFIWIPYNADATITMAYLLKKLNPGNTNIFIEERLKKFLPDTNTHSISYFFVKNTSKASTANIAFYAQSDTLANSIYNIIQNSTIASQYKIYVPRLDMEGAGNFFQAKHLHSNPYSFNTIKLFYNIF